MQELETALHVAASGGQLDVVRALIQGGCDVNAASGRVSLFMLRGLVISPPAFHHRKAVQRPVMNGFTGRSLSTENTAL